MISVTPTELQKGTVTEKTGASTTTLYINYKKPFDYATILSFLRLRAVKGVELITQESYSRTFRMDSTEGFFTVRDNSNRSHLELTINRNDPSCYMAVYNKVRRMFDIDTDFSVINAKFRSDPLLCGGMVDGHVPRLPVAFEPFEFVIRAILGQQISVKAATTLAGRITAHAGVTAATDFPVGLDYFFPTAEEFLPLEIDTLGVTKTRQATLKTVTQAVIDGTIRLTSNQTPETFHRDFSALKGIGDWTVSYVAMRGLGMIDCFPYSDLGVIKALTSKGRVLTKKETVTLAERWRPYRTYATLCLWKKGWEKK